MIAVDANFLIALFDGAKADDGSPEHILHIKAKSLCVTVKQKRTRIVIPYVALGEYLEGVEKPEITLEALKKDARFLISPYDAKATIECTNLMKSNKGFKAFRKIRGRQGIKFDAQIIAIALANNAKQFCSKDADLLNVCKACNLEPCNLDDVEINDAFKQLNMSLQEAPKKAANAQE